MQNFTTISTWTGILVGVVEVAQCTLLNEKWTMTSYKLVANLATGELATCLLCSKLATFI